MKKLFFIAAIASAALAGCTKNEVTGLAGQQEITFVGPVVGAATKAVPGEMPAGYATAESFKVQAWYQEDAVSTTFDPTKTTKVYMDGSSASALCAKYDAGTDDATAGAGAWLPYSTDLSKFVTYYWPKNGKLTFSAYSPADATGTATFDVVKGLKIANFNVETDLTKQYDLLYSNRTYNKTNSTSGSNNTYDGVDLTFNHALSSIHVKVVTDKAYPDGTVKVKSMYLENVWCKGTFVEDLATGTETVSYSTARWEGQSDERLLEVGKTVQNVTATATKYGNTALLIPQKFDHSGVHKVTLTVNYTITNGDGTNLDQVAKFALDSQGVKEWIKGYRYTYNLTFALDQIYFAPTVEEWKDASLSFPAI